MRVFLATLALLGTGCLEAGLEASPTQCPASQVLSTGFLLHVEHPGSLVGRCVAVRLEGASEAMALRKLSDDGRAYLPVDGPGRYVLQVSANLHDDRFCSTEVLVVKDHPGTGLVDVQGETRVVCA